MRNTEVVCKKCATTLNLLVQTWPAPNIRCNLCGKTMVKQTDETQAHMTCPKCKDFDVCDNCSEIIRRRHDFIRFKME